MDRRRALPALATVAAVAVGATALTLLPGGSTPAAAAGLTPWSSCTELLSHYRTALHGQATPWGFGGGGPAVLQEGGVTVAPMAGAPQARATADAVGSGPTGTNLQERDVDEPDLAKLRGGLLVTVVRGRLQVTKAGPRPERLGSLVVDDATSYGAEVLLSGDRALVVLPGHGGFGIAESRSLAPVPGMRTSTTLVLVDLSDPTRPTRLEDWQVDGRYLSARLSGGRVRLVTSSSAAPEPAVVRTGSERELRQTLAINRRTAERTRLADVLPQARRRDGRGTVLSQGEAVGCSQVSRAPRPVGASTLLVTTFDPAKGLAPRSSTGVTTDGDLVYASSERLYVATSRWGTTAPAAGTTAPARDQATTEVHAFATEGDATRYTGTGSVPGYVYGRWALSEHKGFLRVATTRQPPWQDSERSDSLVVVLQESGGALVERGRVDGLGKGERIQSVRYFGDVATVVTFRQTDPLYTLDLSDPARPAVLGELKITGFSTYLHPLGGGLLLGLGMDADPTTGRTTGMQASVFDISDLSAPRLVDRLAIGDGERSSSEALSESRAFSYDPARRLALLPLSSYDDRGTDFAALGVRVSTDGQLSTAGTMEVRRDQPLRRVLHDDGTVYAISDAEVVAGTAAGLRRTGSLDLP